jgi:hypothetical protein
MSLVVWAGGHKVSLTFAADRGTRVPDRHLNRKRQPDP